jgi:hypothetical protein
MAGRREKQGCPTLCARDRHALQGLCSWGVVGHCACSRKQLRQLALRRLSLATDIHQALQANDTRDMVQLHIATAYCTPAVGGAGVPASAYAVAGQ